MESSADPGEWLVVPFVVILTMIVLMQGVLLQGSMTGGVRLDLRDTGVCERAHFFPPFH